MNRKHGRFKRLFALFLVLVMLATSGNGYSMQAVAAGIDETVQTEQTDGAAPQNTQPQTSQTTAPQSSEPQNTQPQTSQTTAPQSSEPESTQPQTDQTAAPADNGQSGADNGANGISLMNVQEDKVFELEASINDVGTRSDEISSGDTFDYIIGYTVLPLSGEANYTGMTIELPLTGELKDCLSVVENLSGPGGLAVSGEDVDSAYVRNNKLYISLKTTLTTGTARTITIKFKTENFKWADGSQIKLEPVLDGKTSTGGKVTGTLADGKDATVTVRASDGWSIDKTAGEVTADEDYYYVPYTVKLENTTSDGVLEDTDRMGRLDLVEGIVIKDIFPKADTGQTNDDGEHIGYPSGGAAAEVTDVKMNGTALAAGSDYTYNPGDGSIVFHRTAVAAVNGAFVSAGTPVNTTYTYKVKYPKLPYLSPSNVPKAEEYWLQNTADLSYALLGQGQRTDSDTAEIVLGEKSETAGFQNLTVKKVVDIGGKAYSFSPEKYGDVSFTLYSDEACTKIAYDFLGNKQAGAEQKVNGAGTVTFYQLAPDTYYLKETSMESGLENSDPVIKVILGEDGTVTVDESETTGAAANNQVKVTNTAVGYGNVEFYKYGKDSEGKKALLPGTTFTLTAKEDASKIYTATSGADGRVFFEGIPSGEYILKETAVLSDEYTVDEKAYEVTVRGGKMNYPSGLPNTDDIGNVGNAPVFENVSAKGKFQFKKVDSTDPDISLKDAQFKLYGPFEEETNELPEDSTPVQKDGKDYILTSTGEIVTSIALPAGYYIMEEITVPEGYALKGNGLTTVVVEANKINDKVYVIENDRKIPLVINKTGTIQNEEGLVVNTEQLAGAVFEIYDSAEDGEPLAVIETYLDGAKNSTSGIRQEDGTFAPLLLAPGTYYYKEIKAPEGYEIADAGRKKIDLSAGNSTFEVKNSAQYGEIFITKVDSKDITKKLSGAFFGVYKDGNCEVPLMNGDTPVTIVTNADGTGVARVPAPEKGEVTYYLKETKAPNGYELSEEVISVKVSKNQRTEAPPIKNDELRSIKVVKEDSKKQAVKLEGASFELYGPYDSQQPLDEIEKLTSSSDFFVGRQPTDNDGACTFAGLLPGKYYYLKEAKAPEGYALAGVTEVKTTEAQEEELAVAVTIKDDRQGKIVIHKTTNMDAGDNGEIPFEGIKFELYKAKNIDSQWEPEGEALAAAATDEKGQVSFDGLDPGDYVVAETVPEGYEGAGTTIYTYVRVSAGMNQEGYDNSSITSIKNTAVMGKVEVDKISSTNAQTHVEATFDIYKAKQGADEAWEQDGNPVSELKTTGTDSYAVSGWLEPGDYVLVEKAVEDGYTLDNTPIHFEIEAGKTTSLTGEKAIENVPKGQVTFKKQAVFAIAGQEGKDPAVYDLKGAIFKLYKKTGDNPSADITADNYDNPIDTIDMTSSASGTSKALSPGKYWIVESTFPDDYYADTESAQQVKINGEDIWVVGSCEVKAGETSEEPIAIKNYTYKGRLRNNKREYGTEELLDGVQFEVYKACDAGTQGAVQAPDGAWVVKVQVSSSTDGGGWIMESGSAGDGSAVSIDIEAGTYYIKEVDDSKLEYETQTKWYPYYGEWLGPITVEEGKETIADFYNYEMKGPGYKTADVTGEALSGAIFVAFETELAASSFIADLKADQIAINEENQNKLKENLEKEEYLAEQGIVDVSTPSDAGQGGEFKFDALKPDETYYIVEAIPPEGYGLNYLIYKVTVAHSGEGFENGDGVADGHLKVTDPLLGQISVKKTTELNGSIYNVSGMKFNIYPAVSDKQGEYIYTAGDGQETAYKKGSSDPVAQMITNANGTVTSILLEAGWYIVEEEVPEDSIVVMPEEKEDTYKVIEIKSGHKEDDSIDITFNNPAKYGKFVLKKVDQDKAPITDVNVKFQLYKKDESSGNYEEVGDPFTMPKTGDCIYESDFLEEGAYKLVEISAPGYTIEYGSLDNALEFTIEGGKITGSTEGNDRPSTDAKADQPLVVKNVEQGSLEVLKVGMFGEEVCDENLQGVEFTLYRDSSCEQIVATKTTGPDGKCSWSNLDAGAYYLKETGIAKGSEADGKYTLDEESVRTVTIAPGARVSLTGSNGENQRFENNTTYGKLQITKADANDTDKGLEGAVFEIYTDKDCQTRAKDILGQAASVTTGSDGTGTSPLIPAGMYYLKETKAPTGYAVDQEITGPYTVASNTTTEAEQPITDTKLFSIVVTKQVTNTSTPLTGATIGLYSTKEAAEAGLTEGEGFIASKVSGSDGKVTFDGLKFSEEETTYYIREIEAPEGYDLNDTVYEVKVAYNASKTEFTFADNGGVLYNDRLGTVTIHKQGSWKDIDDTAQTPVDLKDVVFSLYKVETQGAAHTDGAAAAAMMTTNAQGMATSKGLPAGWYELVETVVPEGYTRCESYWVYIENNVDSEKLYTSDSEAESNLITNKPEKGLFILNKYDGSADVESKADLTLLTGAVFLLEKEVDEDTWEPVNPENPTFTMNSSSYKSAYLEPGDYRITEQTAPKYSYIDSTGTLHTIEFSVDKTPIEFTLSAGVTIELNAYNSPKGTITLTKYGSDSAPLLGGKGMETLAGATFKLYKDESCMQEVEGSLRTTNAQGVAVWESVEPGIYWIKETADGEKAMNELGYKISDEVKKVEIMAGGLVKEIVGSGAMSEKVSFINSSNAGRIRILKTDALGVVKLAGAVFEIYAQDSSQPDGWGTEPVQTLTITDDMKGVVSDFLPAAESGTPYKIVEVKAPDGYTLDSGLSETEQIVTVYPYHNPVETANVSHNCFSFKNRTDDSLTGLKGDIHKQIRETGDGDDETSFTDSTVTANESLLLSAYTLEFKLDGYAGGTNDKAVKNLTVTDNNIGLQYVEKVNDGAESYKDMTVTDKDYTINSVTVKKSQNGDPSKKAGAVVYAQYTAAEKSEGTWHEVKVFEDISSDQVIAFDQRVVGIKVVYTNTLEQFTSDGIILNVTFDSRGGWSTENDHEVRRITNSADITWQDTYLDSYGEEKTREGSAKSNVVVADIPSYENKIPEIQITTEITGDKTTYYSGDAINFKITAENMSSDDPDKILRQPILSFKLPAQTALDETQWTKGFLVTKISADGTRNIIPPSLYMITEAKTSATVGYEGGGNYEESDTYTTTQYAIEFADNQMTRLEPGEKITIEFGGYISYEQKTGFDLVIPAYLSSGAKIPKSAENPKGLSFIGYDQQLRDNDVADSLVDDDLQYVNDTDTRYVTNTNAVQMLKEIGVKESDGSMHWYARGEVAKVHPGEEIYYRLTLYNYSDTYIEKAKLVDIFPCENDTYVLSRNETRGTDIPFGDGYEDMKLLDASADGGASVTWYSTLHNWSNGRNASEETDILQPLYYKTSDWSHGWSKGIAADATALGMEIDFTNGGTSDGLKASGSFQIVLTMKTPGYTADKIGEYYGRYMDNSAAVGVVKKGASNAVTEISLADRTEPNKVRATMELPTGAIGDYVWFDEDLDGVQDENEAPVDGMTVELWRTRHYEFNGSVRHITEKVAQTQTDQNGKYLFTGLSCQYLNSGANEGSTDPSDYVGGEYYTYEVKFINEGKYAGYAFTQQYAGEDIAVDSDADSNGESGEITLRIISNADGTLSGETNLTIDAGITGSYALGDYVWLDTNINGIQDEDEAGVSGVPVFLYRVDGADGRVKDRQPYMRRTTTDDNGYYMFEDLAEGYYVVEFDISNLKKLGGEGYTYQYDFTSVIDVSGGQSGTDSDARHSVDADGRIRRTDVITLTEDALRTSGIYDRTDDRWDAGLVVYSAIGGFVFDDQDYDDLQSVMIPLEGTTVELYEVNADGTLSETPVAAQVVGADGEYYLITLYLERNIKITV